MLVSLLRLVVSEFSNTRLDVYSVCCHSSYLFSVYFSSLPLLILSNAPEVKLTILIQGVWQRWVMLSLSALELIILIKDSVRFDPDMLYVIWYCMITMSTLTQFYFFFNAYFGLFWSYHHCYCLILDVKGFEKIWCCIYVEEIPSFLCL